MYRYKGSHNVPHQTRPYIYAAKQIAGGACGLESHYVRVSTYWVDGWMDGWVDG
jgi:hypothetical protein